MLNHKLNDIFKGSGDKIRIRNRSNDNSIMFIVLFFVIIVVFLIDFFGNGMDMSQTRFISGMNISNVLLQTSVTGILALGMTLVMLMGGIDLSIGWMMCFVGTGTAFMIREFSNMPIIIIVLIAIVISILCQMIMGYIISRTSLEPFIVSLGFMTIYRGLTYLITNGREISIGGQFKFLGKKYIQVTDDFRIYFPVLIFTLLAGIVWIVINYTKFGRRIYAVGGNSKAAFLSGINVKNFKLLVYGISGLFIALATLVQLSRLGTGNPLMGQGKEIDVIAAVVIGGTSLSGGKGNVIGSVIGILLLGVISNALNILGVNPHYQYIMKGLLIIVSILVGYFSGNKSLNKKGVS